MYFCVCVCEIRDIYITISWTHENNTEYYLLPSKIEKSFFHIFIHRWGFSEESDSEFWKWSFPFEPEFILILNNFPQLWYWPTLD